MLMGGEKSKAAVGCNWCLRLLLLSLLIPLTRLEMVKAVFNWAEERSCVFVEV